MPLLIRLRRGPNRVRPPVTTTRIAKMIATVRLDEACSWIAPLAGDVGQFPPSATALAFETNLVSWSWVSSIGCFSSA